MARITQFIIMATPYKVSFHKQFSPSQADIWMQNYRTSEFITKFMDYFVWVVQWTNVVLFILQIGSFIFITCRFLGAKLLYYQNSIVIIPSLHCVMLWMVGHPLGQFLRWCMFSPKCTGNTIVKNTTKTGGTRLSPPHQLITTIQGNSKRDLLWQPSCHHVWRRVIVPHGNDKVCRLRWMIIWWYNNSPP